MVRAVVLALVLLPSCVRAETPAAPAPPAAPTTARALRVEKRFVSNKVPPVHVEWLAVTLPSEAASVAITTTLEKSALASANEFVAMAREAKRDEPRDLNGMPSADTWEMKTTCHLTALRAALVSVRCDEYSYTGGAHGMTNAASRTWEVTGDTARELALDDLFVGSYVEVLDAHLVRELRKSEADWFVSGEMSSVAENLHTWNVTKEGLVFVFDPYEVGSYAQGSHEVVVPWSVLRPIRRRPGPLDAIAPSES